MWSTSDAGETWVSKGNVTSNWLRAIAVARNGTAWAVGEQGTILSIDDGGTVFVREDGSMLSAETIRATQNYPNPFNAQTRITYSLSHAGDVTFELYDILGRLVRSNSLGHREIGEYSLVLDARDLASGMYLYRFTGGQTTHFGKMVLVR